jgi:hypothetical protein
MQMMLGGVVHSMNRNYKLQVTFKDTQEELDAMEMKRRGEAEEAANVPLKPRKKGDLIPN